MMLNKVHRKNTGMLSSAEDFGYGGIDEEDFVGNCMPSGGGNGGDPPVSQNGRYDGSGDADGYGNHLGISSGAGFVVGCGTEEGREGNLWN